MGPGMRCASSGLCRYITRPALANERRERDGAGNVMQDLTPSARVGLCVHGNRHQPLMVGGPGTGKTHLATAIGVSGITRHGKRVRFYPAIDLVNALEQETAGGNAGRIAASLQRMDLVILDELGYLPFSQAGGVLLFHLLSRLYEHTSVGQYSIGADSLPHPGREFVDPAGRVPTDALQDVHQIVVGVDLVQPVSMSTNPGRVVHRGWSRVVVFGVGSPSGSLNIRARWGSFLAARIRDPQSVPWRAARPHHSPRSAPVPVKHHQWKSQ